MFALRQTWNDVFPAHKLYTLDVKVNCMDSGWPITAKVTPSIHVNPNFFKPKESDMQVQLRDKQRELLELQKRKLELELAATKKHIEEQEKQLSMQTATVKTSSSTKMDTIRPNVKSTTKSSLIIDSTIPKIETSIRPLTNISATTTAAAAITTTTTRIPSIDPIESGSVHHIDENIDGHTTTTTTTTTATPIVPVATNIGGGRIAHLPKNATRIAPVNAALISSVRSRDPRIARQMAAAANQRRNEIPDASIYNHHQSSVISQQQQQQQQPISSVDVSSSTSSSNSSIIGGTSNHKNNTIKSTSLGGSSSNNNSAKDERSRYSSSSKASSKSKSSIDKSTSSSSKSRANSERSKSSSSEKSDRKPRKDTSLSSKTSPSSSSSYRSGSIGDRKKSSRSSDGSHSTGGKSDSKTTKLFKDIKLSSKNRNYIRKNRENSKSPTPTSSASGNNHMQMQQSGKDIDLRLMTTKLTATKMAISPIPPEPPTIKTTEPSSHIGGEQNEKKLDIKDIDLRTIVPSVSTILSSIVSNAVTATGGGPILSLATTASSTVPTTTTNSNQSIKRLSQDGSNDEPSMKRVKAENLDELFGKEDVDLRITPGLKPPPPPQISASDENKLGWATIKAEVPKPTNTTLDAVRAKLAEATRTTTSTTNNNNNNNRCSKDIDLRIRPPMPPAVAAIQLPTDESSQEGNEAKFKIIASQAQEQLMNEDMKLEDYNALMNQMMQIRTMQKRESVKRRNLSETIRPISDEDVEFSTSGSETDTRNVGVAQKSKRDRSHENGYAANVNNDLDGTKLNSIKSGKRQRKSKWSPQSPWENNIQSNSTASQPLSHLLFSSNPVVVAAALTTQPPPSLHSTVGWTAATGTGNLLPPFGTGGVPSQIGPQLPSSAPTNNGLVPNALQQLFTQQQITSGPPPPSQQQQHQSSVIIPNSSERTISIDGIPREIRFYDEVAIAFMNDMGREPKEIGFQMGERRIVFNNKDSMVLAFNDVYKPCVIDGQTYHIRFGSPMRELYINNQWYECFFGGAPSQISIAGKVHMVAVDGPPPQVRIGNLRTDLVVGKVDLYIDGNIKIPLYLDAQIQTFELANQVHTIQFADYLLTVLIDNQPFMIEYGGMPKKFRIGNHDRFIRFSVLPNNIVPGHAYIKKIKRTKYHRNINSPTPIIIADLIPPPVVLPGTVQQQQDRNSLMSCSIPPPLLSSSSSSLASAATAGIDSSQTSTMSIPSIPIVATSINNTAAAAVAESSGTASSVPPNVNINDLFQKLLATGIISNAKPAVDIKPKEKFKPITLQQPENWKQRQPALVHALFSGMQCSSCGVRFPPEHSMKYSQHLDWHFRQNRRDRDSARRAHSRRWYYDVADWIQYEEIEDLDDREKNWFESQQAAAATASGSSPTHEDSTQHNDAPLPSCVAGPDDVDKRCDMCHDPFETFFNEDTEEWHLRNALRIDEKTYHPICYEDHKPSTNMDETNAADVSADDNAVDNTIGDDDDDDDDVIVLPHEEPMITEIPDEDDDDASTKKQSKTESNDSDSEQIANESTQQQMNTNENDNDDECNVNEQSDVESNNANAKYEQIGNESDIQILVPQISVLDLDEFEEKPHDESQSIETAPVKIKEEPKDDGYEDVDDDGFEEVEGGTFVSTIVSETIIDDDSQNTLTTGATTTSTSTTTTTASAPTTVPQTTLITSLDGNVQIQDAPQLAPNKIRINITKNVLNKNSVNNSNGNTINKVNDSSLTIANIQELNQQLTAAANIEAATAASIENIQFEYKPSMRDVSFRSVPMTRNGLDTSGLCSIM